MRRIGLTHVLSAGAVVMLPASAVVAVQASRLADTSPVVDQPDPRSASADATDAPGDDPVEVVWDEEWLEEFDLDVTSFEIDLGHLEDPDGAAVASILASESIDSGSPVVDALGASGIPEVALKAYVRAEETMAGADPRCGVDWSLLAAIGRVESHHGQFGGAQLREDGSTTQPIRGIPLDGRPGIALILDTDNGRYDGDTVYDRAVGPMQFIPSTWRSVAADGNGDGIEDPNNIDDAALASAAYLCSGGGDLTSEADRRAAVYRYNRSTEYVNLVLSLAKAYADGRGGDLPSSVASGGSEPTVPDVADPIDQPASVGVPGGLSSHPVSAGSPGSAGGTSSVQQHERLERTAAAKRAAERTEPPSVPSVDRSAGSTNPSGDKARPAPPASSPGGQTPPDDLGEVAGPEPADEVDEPVDQVDHQAGAADLDAMDEPEDSSGRGLDNPGETPPAGGADDPVADAAAPVDSDEALQGGEAECSAWLEAAANEELDDSAAVDAFIECCLASDTEGDEKTDVIETVVADVPDGRSLLCCRTEDGAAALGSVESELVDEADAETSAGEAETSPGEMVACPDGFTELDAVAPDAGDDDDASSGVVDALPDEATSSSREPDDE